MKISKGWKLKTDSSTKMIVWFKDGNVRTFYSLDWKHRLSKQKDREMGLARFRKKIQQYGSLADGIEIYEKDTGICIEKYYEGVRQPIHEKTI